MAPGTFVFVERWRDMAAVQEHFAKDYSRETAAMIRKLAVSLDGRRDPRDGVDARGVRRQ